MFSFTPVRGEKGHQVNSNSNNDICRSSSRRRASMVRPRMIDYTLIGTPWWNRESWDRRSGRYDWIIFTFETTIIANNGRFSEVRVRSPSSDHWREVRDIQLYFLKFRVDYRWKSSNRKYFQMDGSLPRVRNAASAHPRLVVSPSRRWRIRRPESE